MSKAACVLAIALVTSACASVAPVPIRAGDVCFHCRSTITNTALAAEVISEQGHAFKFNSVTCMTDYLRTHPEETFRATFVTDYNGGRMLRADGAWFVPFQAERFSRAPEFAAFRSKDAAIAFGREHDTTPTTWDEVLTGEAGHATH